MVSLRGLSNGEIVANLKHYFTDEELDKVSGKLDEFLKDCETIEDLVDEIDDYLVDGEPTDLL